MKITTQLLSINKNREQGATITFGCSVESILQIVKFVDEIRIKFWIEGAKEDEIVGNVVSSTVSSVSADAKSKFKIKCPGSENIKTSQLSTLCGQELEINLEIDV